MADEQKKPTMPEMNLGAADNDDEPIDITKDVEELDEGAAGEAAGDAAGEGPPGEGGDAIEALRAERDDFRDRFMRALADAENARKRGDRDRREAEQYGGSRLARDMLPVFDNLTRALEAATEEQKAAAAGLIEGVELTLRELLNVFEKHGIVPIRPEAGDRFDPQLHEAMFEAPMPGTKAGDIIQVSQVGFKLHDRLLRAAHVGVSSTREPGKD